AARAGHDVVMTPEAFLYLNAKQSGLPEEPGHEAYLPLEKVYGFEPVPPDLTATEAPHVLGAQANLWTEYVNGEHEAELMVFPRLAALAEVDWTAKAEKDWDDFTGRLGAFLPQLDAMGLDYFVPVPTGFARRNVFHDRFVLAMRKPLPNAEIRYTLDG